MSDRSGVDASKPADGTASAWQLLAFVDELREEITPLAIGRHRLIALRLSDSIRVFDGTCPHRGAHLGYGGRLSGSCVVCPFHGRRIGLGADSTGPHVVAEHPVRQVGPAVFVNFGTGPDHGFAEVLDQLGEGHQILPAISQQVRVDAGWVIENAFDPEHFAAVHRVQRAVAMKASVEPDGALAIEGALETPGNWKIETYGGARFSFRATAYSPFVVVTRLGAGDQATTVITGAVPNAEGCQARVLFAVPDTEGRQRPSAHLETMIAGARLAFGQDIAVWEHLDPHHVPCYDQRDRAVLAFRSFCDGFSV